MVYFIQAGNKDGLIKIGKTDNFRHRFSGLQTASPEKLTVLGLLPDAPDDAPYHTQFRSSHKRGEWFRPSAELLAFIQALPPFTIPRSPRKAKKSEQAPVQKSAAEARAEFAAEVLNQVSLAKAGSPERLSYMRLYAKLRGWKSWREVPAFARDAAPVVNSHHFTKEEQSRLTLVQTGRRFDRTKPYTLVQRANGEMVIPPLTFMPNGTIIAEAPASETSHVN